MYSASTRKRMRSTSQRLTGTCSTRSLARVGLSCLRAPRLQGESDSEVRCGASFGLRPYTLNYPKLSPRLTETGELAVERLGEGRGAQFGLMGSLQPQIGAIAPEPILPGWRCSRARVLAFPLTFGPFTCVTEAGKTRALPTRVCENTKGASVPPKKNQSLCDVEGEPST